MANKKIRNATEEVYDGIRFKSKLEARAYATLLRAGFKPNYEKLKFTLWEGIKPTVPFYNRNKKKEFVLETKKMVDITYTPDFTFKYKNFLVVIEMKGKENDCFYMKKKMFRKCLESLKEPSIFFEVRTRRELLQTVDIIKNLHEPAALENKGPCRESSLEGYKVRKKIPQGETVQGPEGPCKL